MAQNGAQTGALSTSFLSEEQRAALDAALKAKAAENAIKAHEQHLYLKAFGSDRKSRNTKGSGAAKKGGRGGKFTWGSILTDGDQAERVLDKNDPNYDSDEERAADLYTQHQRLKDDVRQYKQEVASIVEEYFVSGDIADVAESLEDLGVPGFMHYFVKRLITCALDKNNREREMASVLLSSLYANVIPPDQVQKGFGNLIDSIADLVLDVPDAPELLSLFITRAVVDDVLPPAIVGRMTGVTPACQTLKHKVEALMSARHGAEKVLRCWGSGAGLTYQDTKDSINRLLREFEDSGDVEEAARCLHALNVPFFHHEVVKQAIHKAMDSVLTHPSQAQTIVGLLVRMSTSGEISSVQLRKGLGRVRDSLEDLQLDNPAAKEQHAAVMEMVQSAGLLELDEASALTRRLSDASIASTVGNGSTATNGAHHAAHSVAAFKVAARAAIIEYFDSCDVTEVARRLRELDDPGLLHIFVKIAVTTALDRRTKERELTSELLEQLHPEVLGNDVMSAGFTRLLAATDDLVLDCPDAVHLLSLFLGRAIVDEVLPPSFLTQVLPSLRSDSLGVNVVKATGAVLSARHGAERMTNAWHSGALTVDQTRAEISDLIDEYLASHDLNEASRCLLELGVPAFHHEVVFKAMELAFEKGPKAESDVALLLGSLASSNIITQTQMAKGFQRIREALDEEALDYGPHARKVYDTLCKQGAKDGWLVSDAPDTAAA